MGIASLVPSATEMLFALGVGDDVTAVTHECDYPAAVLDLPKVTRDVIGPGLAPAEIDRAVRELTEQGQSIYELDEAALRRLQPDLIVTQALCAVCAVSYDDVRAVAERLESRPQVLALDPHTLGEVLGDVRTLAQATDRKDAGVDLVQDAASRIDRGALAVGGGAAGRRGWPGWGLGGARASRCASRRSSGSIPCSSPVTGRRSSSSTPAASTCSACPE